MKKYDVVIIGAGPAGLFAADELIRSSQVEVALVEKGLDLPERVAIRSRKQSAPEGTSTRSAATFTNWSDAPGPSS